MIDKTSGEINFHKERVAFIIYNSEVMYLKNSIMSHEEWCRTMGIDEDTFMQLVRGYVRNNEIVYYQGDFECNDEVIKVCNDTYEQIAKDNNLTNYSVYCGVAKGKVGEVWKPIYKVK